jgi:hypothetical protein
VPVMTSETLVFSSHWFVSDLRAVLRSGNFSEVFKPRPDGPRSGGPTISQKRERPENATYRCWPRNEMVRFGVRNLAAFPAGEIVVRVRLSTGIRLALVASFLLSSPAFAEAPDKDPRNWPTVSRLIADRYETSGRVVSLRVHARESKHFACGYRHSSGRLMAFTLLGGPLETLTGYISKDLGRELQDDPWMPITVQVRFDPDKVTELCPDQVDILKWSRSWKYPAGSLSPGRPDPTLQPSPSRLAKITATAHWAALTGRRLPGRLMPGKEQVTEAGLIGKSVRLTAGARISIAYDCMFRDSTRSHFALRMHDGRGNFIHAYARRTPEARKLMDYIALQRDVLLAVKGVVLKQPHSNYCRPQLELSSWEIPKPAEPLAD